MAVSPQRLTRWPLLYSHRHAAIYSTSRRRTLSRRKTLGENILRTLLVTVDIRSRTIYSRVGEWDWGGVVCGARDGPWCRVGQRRIAGWSRPWGQRRTQMWVSSRSAGRVISAARASRSRRGPARRFFCTNGQPWTCVRHDPDRLGRPTGPAELALVEAYALALAQLGDRRRYWPESASQALGSPDRRSTTRSSPRSAPSGAAAFCALAMGVDSAVLVTAPCRGTRAFPAAATVPARRSLAG